MYSRNLKTIFSLVACISIFVPVIVTGKPHTHLGGILIEKEHKSTKDVVDSPSTSFILSTSTQERGLKVVPVDSTNKPEDLIGFIHFQVFLGKANSGERVKIHDSNSSFAIPSSLSSSENSKSRSNTKCDNEDEIRYEPDGKCYRVGDFIPGIDSPCADDFEQFVPLSDQPGYGSCFCVDFKDSTYRPVVYWEKSNRCHWLYDQGPCEKGQWLVYSNTTDSDGTSPPICAARTCPENTEKDTFTAFPKFWFEYQGKCLKTETPNAEYCGEEKKKIYFQSDKPEPICADRRPLSMGVKGLASGVGSLSCKAGHKKLLSGDCKRIATFE